MQFSIVISESSQTLRLIDFVLLVIIGLKPGTLVFWICIFKQEREADLSSLIHRIQKSVKEFFLPLCVPCSHGWCSSQNTVMIIDALRFSCIVDTTENWQLGETVPKIPIENECRPTVSNWLFAIRHTGLLPLNYVILKSKYVQMNSKHTLSVAET